MHFDLTEWLNLAIRWLHVTAAVAWIGGSFHFIGLDLRLKKPRPGTAPEGVTGEDWAVHGGGFYHSQKYQTAPEALPEVLHWTKWESYFTWLSGFSLLVLVYYVGARNFLVDPAKAALSGEDATIIGMSALIAGWLFYHLACKSPLGRDNRVLGVVWFAFLLGMAIFLNAIFNARGAYLHIGAIVGTAMVGNVFFVIIPNQRKVVAALKAGEQPDPKLGLEAKQRSLHNNYMTLPVLFIMISHHYPMTYGAERPWLVLALLGLTGVAVRHVFNLRHIGAKTGPAIALAVALALVSVTYVSFEKAGAAPAAASPGLTYANVAPIFAKRCQSCHSEHPTNPAFPAPPLGVALDSYDHVHAVTDRIKRVAVDSDVMPLGNLTGMTDGERQELGAWIAQGAPK
ncbi:urate hydroxylase PuuD [Novosphingobium beihaiensis]|uniref:Urate hydroxylase PuuD n=1 Tax=Novosphingobium beihaiensis TaxID=2930389 RepID=A0ABT0BP45_9SPHN|nr:urate hydroxylase PuuD [Novosphingobium beihaiensis]MCJ2186743.1 urate hydroxylase PuuD [Novosphingobium beihaiensis]